MTNSKKLYIAALRLRNHGALKNMIMNSQVETRG